MGIIKNLLVVFLLLMVSCAGTNNSLLDIDVSELSKKHEVVYYDPALFGGWCHDNGMWIYFDTNGDFYMSSGYALPNDGSWKNIGNSLYINLNVIDKVVEVGDSLYLYFFKPEEEKYRGTYNASDELLGMLLNVVGSATKIEFILSRCEESK